MKIPELLQTISGETVNTIEDWEKFRRPEIMNLLTNFIYGERPIEKPDDLFFTVTDMNCENDSIIKQKLLTEFSGYSFYSYIYLPKGQKNVPSFVYVMHEYQENNCDLSNSLDCPNVDINEIIKRGYGLIIMPTRNLYPDFEYNTHPIDDYKQGILKVFDKTRSDNSWAVISAWSWGASRLMDYIETDQRFDKTKVTVAGHSRGGKTALWTAATDKRFACAISNNSGCAGASMHKCKSADSEHIADINRTDWFCERYKNYNNKEEMLPCDQHMLIASIAPRAVYVSSSDKDLWADPISERLSCRLAGEVYSLYGKPGAVLPDEPVAPNIAFHDGTIGYHVKSGSHSITWEDWQFFLDFTDKKIKNI